MPKTREQHKKEITNPAVCDLFPVRDFLDNVMVRDDGSFVAGYHINGAMTYFANEDDRNNLKGFLESLLLQMPDESMRVQFRYEVVENASTLLDSYEEARTCNDSHIALLDEGRVQAWRKQDANGEFLTRVLGVYFIWNPEKHRQHLAASGNAVKKRSGSGKQQGSGGIKGYFESIFGGVSVSKNVQLSYEEHSERLGQFEALMTAMKGGMARAGLSPVRMTHQEIFIEIKRALNPVNPHKGKLRNDVLAEEPLSAAEQLASVNILGVTENYVNINGILWSAVTMKMPPDATFPGLMRDLFQLRLPYAISTNISIPDQKKVLATYKRRYTKMMAALKDGKGGKRADMGAEVSADELLEVQRKIISSSVKTSKVSLTVTVRTSKPAFTEEDYAEAEQEIAEKVQRVLGVISGMNGAQGYIESLALRRIIIGTLPGFAGEDLRDMDLLTEHAADMVPVEVPWAGTLDDPAMMFRTPYRQLLPFSHFSPSIENANMILCATSGTGKGVLVGKMLLTYARLGAKVSILERGDSYASAVEYMGGQMITMSLDSPHVINPFDLDEGETSPSNDHLSFLKSLVRYMIGTSSASDPDIIDSVILMSIRNAYSRARNRTNPIPTLSDVRDELVHFNDEGKNQKVNEEALIAATKLRPWVEDGMYACLFDRHTTVNMNSQWLYFNVEQLKDDPKLETAMSLLIAYATTKRAKGSNRSKSITVLDECWALLESPMLGDVVVQLFRTARKRNACVWGISQAVADFTGTPDKPNKYGEAILTTTATKFIGRQKGNLNVLTHYVHLNEATVNYIKSLGMTEKGQKSQFVGVIGEKAETTFSVEVITTPEEYWIMTTYPREKAYRSYWHEKHKDLPVAERYVLLGQLYSHGISALPKLPEEKSGEVDELATAFDKGKLQVAA
jgi:hypothetical protein